jgi:hypothetical protein
MLAGLNPGVHANWDRRQPAQPARIDVAGLVGLAERGPVDRAGVVESWPQFVALYGDLQPWACLAYAVRGFFDNGGRRLHIVRVVAPARASVTAGVQPADGSASIVANASGWRAGALATLEQRAATVTAGAQPADRRSSLVAALAGFVAGSSVTLHQSGAAPARLRVAALDPVAKALVWDSPIPAGFDLTQPVICEVVARDERLVAAVAGTTISWDRPLDARFDLAAPVSIAVGAGTAETMLPDENGEPLLHIEAASSGRWGNRLSVRLTTSFAAEIATRTLPLPDPADQLTLQRVDALAPGSVVEVRQAGVAPVRRALTSVDRARARVVLTAPLAGFDLAAAANGTKPIQLRRLSFALSVSEAGQLRETHTDCDLPDAAAPERHAVNRSSARIRIRRAGPATVRWLDPGSALLLQGRELLIGGRDGIAMLGLDDLLGRIDAPPSGLRLFDAIAEPAALALPDLHLPSRQPDLVPPPPPPAIDPCALCVPPDPAPALPAIAEITEGFTALAADAVLFAQAELVEHCAARGDRIALLDPPPGPEGAPFRPEDLLAWRRHFDSSYAACCLPWLAVTDPLARLPGGLRLVPPSGHVLGQIAAGDERPGHAAPANKPLVWVSALAAGIDDTLHGLLNDNGVNVILSRPGRAIRLMGARTLSSQTDWQQLVVRRLLLRLKRSLALALAWAVFEPANASLETRVVALIEGLLEGEWQAGRLLGATPAEAFQVAIRRDAAAADNGQFIVEIAIAPSHPAEFLFLRITRTLDGLELAEAGAGTGWPS